jgi:hypothetical protein
MIKSFRKIRQKLLSENKFSKYLIYAIGEILLVVIGILIALQIGNINEQRKNQDHGIAIKQALKSELISDVELMKSDLEYIEEELRINNLYAERLSSETSNSDTLLQIVQHEYFIGFNGVRELDKTTFKSLESTGRIDLIGSDLAVNVQKYYMDRELIIHAMNINDQIYYNMVESFVLKYPNDTFAIRGPLQEAYWESIDLNDLNGMFNGLLTVRLFNLNVRKLVLNESIDSTQSLIHQLD